MKKNLSSNEPLYIKIKNKNYEDLQILDKETIEWIRKKQETVTINAQRDVTKFVPLKKSFLFKMAPRDEWFANNSRVKSIHGKSHALRAILFSYIICCLENVRDYEKYLVAAALHDIKRISDNLDIRHAERASKWFIENKFLFEKYNFSELEIKEIAYAIKYHDTDYNLIPRGILSKYEKIINVIKCADALDRFRLPKKKWWPKKYYFKIKIPLKLFSFSKEFFYDTERLIIEKSFSPIDSVLYVGLKRRLIR